MKSTIKLFVAAAFLISSNFANANNPSEKQFTVGWFMANIPTWEPYKAFLKDKPGKTCLEVGSFEGMSTIYMAENLCNGKESYVDAVDTWNGSIEHTDSEKNKLYERFTHNLKDKIETKQVRVHRGQSSDILMKFVQNMRSNKQEKYDLIYIDASHIAKDVLMDAVLAWELLKVGGIMIFDDYSWSTGENVPQLEPKAAIDGFLNSYLTTYELILKGSQVHIKKLADEPKNIELK